MQQQQSQKDRLKTLEQENKELREQNEHVKEQNELIKAELCAKDNSYSFCG